MEQKNRLSSIGATYFSVIVKAIESSKDRRLKVDEIYKYIESNYGKFLPPKWKNSIRHALSLKDFFYLDKTVNKRGGYWRLVGDYRSQLMNQRKKINKKTAQELACLKQVREENKRAIFEMRKNFLNQHLI